MTLNRMYHCVPRIISGLSQMFGLSCNATMPRPRSGTAGWPEMPPGTGLSAGRCVPRAAACRPRRRPAPRSALARAISTNTRNIVASPSSDRLADIAQGHACEQRNADLPQRHRGASDQQRRSKRDRHARCRLRSRSAARTLRAGDSAHAPVKRAPQQANSRLVAAPISRERRSMRQDPGAAAARRPVPARSEIGPPRRPAAGTAAGRRSGSRPAWRRSPSRRPRDLRCSMASAM